MPGSSIHFIERCEHNLVAAQCRCPASDKVVRHIPCSFVPNHNEILAAMGDLFAEAPMPEYEHTRTMRPIDTSIDELAQKEQQISLTVTVTSFGTYPQVRKEVTEALVRACRREFGDRWIITVPGGTTISYNPKR